MHCHQSTALLLAAAVFDSVSGQLLTGIDGYQFTTDTALCDQSLEDANATGIFSWNPNVPQGEQLGQPDNDSGTTLPISVGVTVKSTLDVANASLQWDLWYDTNGANYSYSFGLGYDVCAYVIEPTSTNTLWRGQDDEGFCLQTFDAQCVDELESLASGFALDQVLNEATSIRANLTADSLPQVCKNIAASIEANFPSHCQAFMNGTVQVAGGPLTSYNETQFMDGCTLSDTDTNSTFRHVYTYTQYTLDNPRLSEDWYDILNWLVAPVLMTFMPIANSAARASIPDATSKMMCVHANSINPGSDQPGAAPTPTPVDFSSDSGLSGGAIAGVVVGIIAVLAIIAGLAFFFWRRKRKAREEQEKNVQMPPNEHPPAYSADSKKPGEEQPLVEAPADDAGVKELSGQNEVRPELQTYKSGERVELAGEGTTPKVEMQPAELFAGVPDGKGGLAR